MRSLIYTLVFASVLTASLSAQALIRSLDSKTMLSIYSQVLAPAKDPGTVMGQDPQMLQGQDPQMIKIRPIIFYGQNP